MYIAELGLPIVFFFYQNNDKTPFNYSNESQLITKIKICLEKHPMNNFNSLHILLVNCVKLTELYAVDISCSSVFFSVLGDSARPRDRCCLWCWPHGGAGQINHMRLSRQIRTIISGTSANTIRMPRFIISPEPLDLLQALTKESSCHSASSQGCT